MISPQFSVSIQLVTGTTKNEGTLMLVGSKLHHLALTDQECGCIGSATSLLLTFHKRQLRRRTSKRIIHQQLMEGWKLFIRNIVPKAKGAS
jgi:hypothetical protein